MRPLGDGFIKLIRMLIAPIVFCTVVVGIAQMSALKELGRIGLRAMIYFEVVSSLALVIGLIVVTLVEPGVGINVDQTAMDSTAVASYTTAAKSLTATDFVFIVLGIIARMSGFNLWKLLNHIKEEILIVLGTSSSESALPRIMDKLEHLGCSKAVVGLVVPTGYSFNLDGTSIYMTMGAIFVAQATNAHLTFGEELGILAILLLTSKGAAAVTGSGFITLAATLAA